MANDIAAAFGATGVESSGGGERVGVHFRAPHASPQPIIKKSHPAAAHHARPRATTTRHATHRRGTVVGGSGPYTVQLAGSDTTITVAAAQHVGAGTVNAGGTVLVAVLDEGNAADALIVAAY